MKKESDELTNLFRTQLGGAELPIRNGFWEELQEDIPAAVSRRRQTMRYFSAAASVLLILAGASAAFLYFSPKEEIANAFTQVAVSAGTTGKMGEDVIREELPVIRASSVSPVPVSSKPAAATATCPDEEESFSVSLSMTFSISSTSTVDNRNRTTGQYERNTSYAGGLDHGHTTSTATEQTTPAGVVEEKKHKAWSTSAFVSVGLLNDRVYSPEIIKHKQPFSAGLSVHRELSKRWGVESGLVYTHLKSTFATGGDARNAKGQSLHYVGIPVKANLNLYTNKRVNLYASAGGMVEKCVAGDVKPTSLQLSLNAAMGVQCKLTGGLSVYAEPGLSYHFDDGSSVATIRKEKPLNINLLCGVRMTY